MLSLSVLFELITYLLSSSTIHAQKSMEARLVSGQWSAE